MHDRAAFDPVRTGIALLVTAKRTWSGFAWRADDWIDKLTGSTLVRTMIDAGAGADEVVGAWQDELGPSGGSARGTCCTGSPAGPGGRGPAGPGPDRVRGPPPAPARPGVHRCAGNSTTCW